MNHSGEASAQVSPQPALKRSLGLGLISLYGLGNILGAGIYVLVGKVVGTAGVHAPLAFVIAAMVAALSAFTYGELAARYPVSAGEAVYVDAAFGVTAISIIVGLLIAVAGMVSAATLVRGFVGYLHVFIQAPGFLVMVLLVLAIGAVAAWGIGESARVAAIFTLIEIGGLLLVVYVARESFAALPARAAAILIPPSATAWQGTMLGAFLAFYAFIGFEDMVNVAEEVERPERNLPLGILVALVISTALYFVVVLAAELSVPAEVLARSDAPLALVYATVTGGSPVVISAIGLFAVVNGALIQLIMATRILYGMGARRWLPVYFSRVNPVTRTPLAATAVVSSIILVLALWVPLVGLAGATSALILAIFVIVSVALIRLKLRRPDPPGIKTIPMWIPMMGALSSALLLAVQARNLW
jgi:APA family basic amino acid/polyamine antiporter